MSVFNSYFSMELNYLSLYEILLSLLLLFILLYRNMEVFFLLFETRLLFTEVSLLYFLFIN